ncbi:transglycosylase family protein, partial [Streptomyces pyridomyceticus]
MSPAPRTTRARTGAALGALCLSIAATALTAGPAHAASIATWDKVAQCESGGDWSINTGNGFYGGLQFTLSTWKAYGGTQYQPFPHQATKEQQILIGEKVLAGQGQRAWPVCGPRAGLGSDHTVPYRPTTGVGVYRPGDQTFYEANSSGGVLGSNRFGAPNDVPLMGHWNAGSFDTVGIYRPT